MAEYKVFWTTGNDIISVNQKFDKWLKENPGFEPHSNPSITIKPATNYSDETIQIVQPFVKYSNQLNDKYMNLLVKELQHIPGTGTAFQAAQERFNRGPNAYTDTPEPPVKSGGKTRRHKSRRSYKTRRSY